MALGMQLRWSYNLREAGECGVGSLGLGLAGLVRICRRQIECNGLHRIAEMPSLTMTEKLESKDLGDCSI